jgi:hypothetical protein
MLRLILNLIFGRLIDNRAIALRSERTASISSSWKRGPEWNDKNEPKYRPEQPPSSYG